MSGQIHSLLMILFKEYINLRIISEHTQQRLRQNAQPWCSPINQLNIACRMKTTNQCSCYWFRHSSHISILSVAKADPVLTSCPGHIFTCVGWGTGGIIAYAAGKNNVMSTTLKKSVMHIKIFSLTSGKLLQAITAWVEILQYYEIWLILTWSNHAKMLFVGQKFRMLAW